MYAAFRQIMAAARAGTISPEGALRWARRAASGEPVDVLASLSGPAPGPERREWMVVAAQPDLAQQVLDALLRLVDGVGAGSGPSVDPEFTHLFPPGPGGSYVPPTPPLIYPGEGQGRRDRRPVTSWDGYMMASAAPGEMSDEEADALFPPRTEAEADRRRVAAAAPLVEDLHDEDLYRLLFGDLPGGGGR
jgi:hypothetical protein